VKTRLRPSGQPYGRSSAATFPGLLGRFPRPPADQGSRCQPGHLIAHAAQPACRDQQNARCPNPKNRIHNAAASSSQFLPSSCVNLLSVPPSLRRGVPKHLLQDQRCCPWPSPGTQWARLPLAPLARAEISTLQGSLYAADRSIAIVPLRRRSLCRRRGPCYRGSWHLPGPDFHRLAGASLSLGFAPVLTSFELFGARAGWAHWGQFSLTFSGGTRTLNLLINSLSGCLRSGAFHPAGSPNVRIQTECGHPLGLFGILSPRPGTLGRQPAGRKGAKNWSEPTPGTI
jgi:hypothetical protein